MCEIAAETTTSALDRRQTVASPVVTTADNDGAAHRKSIVVFSGDFDKAMAAFIIANGAASMGSEVTLFFTFWGITSFARISR